MENLKEVNICVSKLISNCPIGHIACLHIGLRRYKNIAYRFRHKYSTDLKKHMRDGSSTLFGSLRKQSYFHSYAE